jgi:hypothetical protein
MKKIRKIILWLKWSLGFDNKPYAVTFKAYLDKIAIDDYRKKCNQKPLKDTIKDYWEAGKKVDKRYKDALEDMVRQFAYNGHDKKMPFYYTGGLSALEHAFDILGWIDPYPCPENKCEIKKCPKFATSGSPTKKGYKRMCIEHFKIFSI